MSPPIGKDAPSSAPALEPWPEEGRSEGGTAIYRLYRSALLSPQRVRELSQLRPWRAALHTAWLWLLIVAAWTLVAWRPTWWAVLLAIPVIGTRYYALFIIGHD